MGEKRQKSQEQLAFPFVEGSEASRSETEGSEAPRARRETENPAANQRWMEEVWERENRRAALKRVRANQGSPGIDGMTVDELPEYLEQHWPAIGEQLVSGTYEPKPVLRVEIDKPDGGVLTDTDIQIEPSNFLVSIRGAKAWHPDGAGPVSSASGAAGFAEAVGPDVFRTQLWFSTGTVP
jgi:hypothetical protein